MPTPQVIQVLDDYRDRLDSLESASMQDMVKAWAKLESSISKDIEDLAQEIERRKLSGQVINEQLLYTLDSYKRYLANVQAELKRYTAALLTQILPDAEYAAGLLGIAAANESMILSMGGIGVFQPFWEQLSPSFMRSMLGAAADGSPLRILLQNGYSLAADSMMEVLMTGIGRGYGYKQIAENMRQVSRIGLNRSLLIAKTETARVYRTGVIEQYRKNSAVYGFYRLAKKSTACLACLILDGQFYKREEDLEDHPRGQCGVVAAIKGVPPMQWEKGRDWFEKQPEDYQRSLMGDERYDLWKLGQVKLDDFVGWHKSEIWGNSPKIISLKQINIESP